MMLSFVKETLEFVIFTGVIVPYAGAVLFTAYGELDATYAIVPGRRGRGRVLTVVVGLVGVVVVVVVG